MEILNVIFGGGGLLLMIACPIVLIWGFFRTVLFEVVEVGTSLAGAADGTTFAKTQKKSGYRILLAGVLFGVIGWISFGYIAPLFNTPVEPGVQGAQNVQAVESSTSRCFIKTEQFVYFNGNHHGNNASPVVVPQVDAATFTDMTSPSFISSCWAKDATHVYWADFNNSQNAKQLESADPATFVVLSELYGKDSAHVYYGFGAELQSIVSDPTTFEVIRDDYAKDSVHVYQAAADMTGDFKIVIVPGADPKTFKP